MILLKRLLEAGADERVWPAQFAFRRKRGTEDALHCARRSIELAWAHRGGHLHLLALDWRKAFDSINASSLLQALRKFGIPDPFVEMVRSIYSERSFLVTECGITSEQHMQQSGICQGCPLSPFLFVIVMTVLMDIARKDLSPLAAKAFDDKRLFDILYADDTLLLSSSAEKLQRQLELVVDEGRRYGLELNWKKTLAMRIGTMQEIKTPNGEAVQTVAQAVYLGGLLCLVRRQQSQR